MPVPALDVPLLPRPWGAALTAALVVVNLVASLHAILRKRDVRAATGWTGLIWLVPGIGVLLYATLGLNRIKRRASLMHRARRRAPLTTTGQLRIARARGQALADPQLHGLATLAEAVADRPALSGNGVALLRNGDEAYPAMLDAIAGARHTIGLSTYIFGDDAAGQPFIEALAAAVRRGVEVRVLVDGVGARYSWPPAHRALRAAGVPTALFLAGLRDAGLGFFNLRTHRKILTVDGRVAFTGGINIQARNVHAAHPTRAIQDLHFRLDGPIVAQVQDAFAEDWAFTTDEFLEGTGWYPRLEEGGETVARVITDGPDGDLEVLHTILLGALAMARESVRIVTPYFLPDQSLIAALGVAARRGVQVDIVLPSRGNIPPVQWAAAAQLWQVLRPGCRVFFTPSPFDHSKVMVVDRRWALIGSTNWDPRSLRLNFELDVELYCPRCAAALDDLVADRIARARQTSLAEFDGRPFLIKVRDGIARLFSPYL
jgi:cardiolipin synthase A/B